MDTDEFPLDHSSFTIVFPCFIVRSEDEEGFAFHALGGGDYMVAVLTDEDSLNSYRHDIGLPDRGASRFHTPQELLAALHSLPTQVTHVAFDLHRHNKERWEQTGKLWRIGHVKKQVADQLECDSH
jgi:hypothetical protein